MIEPELWLVPLISVINKLWLHFTLICEKQLRERNCDAACDIMSCLSAGVEPAELWASCLRPRCSR